MAPRCWERAPSTTSDSVIRRCRTRYPVCPKADATARFMSTCPRPTDVFKAAGENMSETTRYVALIDGKPGAYGVIFPDLPGCTAMGKTIDKDGGAASALASTSGANVVASRTRSPPAAESPLGEFTQGVASFLHNSPSNGH